MLLINSTTYKLEEFNSEIPEYAILSHTWEDKELSFQAMRDPEVKDLAGYAKVAGCCAQAKLDGFNYVWIDTCCIDKTSSAELSEAINTMYQWYKRAQVCYAYLPDVPNEQSLQIPDSFFRKSRWYTRGWTLQELIAPSSLVFYGKEWVEIGTKLSLQELVSEITGIPASVLKFGDVQNFSVAQRMSWASKRQTTRVEDMAYCLMGIFGVHMPMLYGEGIRAFGRLQEEIMKTSDDHTLFAWTEQGDEHRWINRGVLAASPAEFTNSDTIIQSKPILENTLYSMTNKGLRIELPLLKINDRVHFAILNFKRLSSPDGADDLLGILLEKLQSDKGEYFARIVADEIMEIPRERLSEAEQAIVYIVPNNVEDPRLKEIAILRRFRVDVTIAQPVAAAGPGEKGVEIYNLFEVFSSVLWWKRINSHSLLLPCRPTGVLGVLKFTSRHQHSHSSGVNGPSFVAILGRCEGLVWCDVVTDGVESTSLVRIYDKYRNVSYEWYRDRVVAKLEVRNGGGEREVRVAVRKRGRRMKKVEEGEGKEERWEYEYEGEYAVLVSVHKVVAADEQEKPVS